MISVLPRHIPLRGVSHCCHGCLQYTAIISPDTHTRSGRLHSSHPPRSSPARLPAALHLALRSGVLGRCSPHHHPHSHPGETRETEGGEQYDGAIRHSIRQNTDTIPTQYRHNTDTIPTQYRRSPRHNTDIVPTQYRHSPTTLSNFFKGPGGGVD